MPIGQGFGVYANYAHGFLEAHVVDRAGGVETANAEVDSSYDLAELGFTYTPSMDYLPAHMPLSAATVYAGYRWQNFETDADRGLGERSDTTRGFAVGINLAF